MSTAAMPPYEASHQPVIAADGVSRTFGRRHGLLGERRSIIHAVDDVSLSLVANETLGIVGESGSGKSTLARLLAGLDRPSKGEIRIGGIPAQLLTRKARALRIQYVFQDPVSSLNPRHTIRQILERPLRRLRKLRGAEVETELRRLLDAVSLEPEYLERFPHEFSGGQAQRIGIARALAGRAEILILDEPVSALDVSIQAQILDLLTALRREFGLTYIFISHDLAVVESIADRVAVMYFGHIVEAATTPDLFSCPRHPYTGLLLASVPTLGRATFARRTEAAELPDPTAPPAGCPFSARCPNAESRCKSEYPSLRQHAPGHWAACHNPLQPRVIHDR